MSEPRQQLKVEYSDQAEAVLSVAAEDEPPKVGEQGGSVAKFSAAAQGRAVGTQRHDASVDAKATDIHTSFNGYEFDFAADMWQIDGGSVLNAGGIRSAMAAELADGCLLTLANAAQTMSSATAEKTASSLRDYLRFASPGAPLRAITTTNLTNYRADLVSRAGNESILIKLRAFFKSWHALRNVGISDEVIAMMSDWRLTARPAGTNVASMDPEKGPLEPTELHALAAGVRSAYEHELIDHAHLAICLLLIYTGRRPSQIAYLKCVDLDDTRTDDEGRLGPDGLPRRVLLIHIPRAKQHGVKFREQRRAVEIIDALWLVLVFQRAQVKQRFNELLQEVDWQLQASDLATIYLQLPLFPAWKKLRPDVRALAERLGRESHADLLTQLNTLVAAKEWHPDSSYINWALTHATASADVESRTGAPLNINPNRLRYTKGTDAARDGLGREVIAWLLDQTELRTVDVYVKNLPEHAIPINKAMAKSATLNQLARLFRGQVVDTEADAMGGSDPAATRILFKGEGAATCGNRMQCGMGRLPIPCYTCDHFQPWLDGPHEQVLDELLRLRQERLETLGVDQKTMIEASDGTIIAVVQVIQRCELRRADLAAAQPAAGDSNQIWSPKQ